MACVTTKRGRKVIDFYDQHGKRRLKTLPKGITVKDARKELNNILKQVEHGTFYEPKSPASKRKIDLGPTVMAQLKKWKVACPPTDLDLIFPSDTGTPLDNNNLVRRHFDPALRRAGLRKIRFHDLRHTFASLLIDQGEHPKYVQVQMGHSSINVTMDVYGHLMNTVNQTAARKLDSAVFNESGDNLETEQGEAEEKEAVSD